MTQRTSAPPPPAPPEQPSRRVALSVLGGLGAALLGGACSDDAVGPTGGAGGAAAGGGGAGEGGAPAGGGGAGVGGEGGGGGGGGWATEGTIVMQGKDYGDPFAGGIGAPCVVYPTSTEGPCHAPSPTRQDVSEGHPGLPTRLELLVVDEACDPVPNAVVEIWHTDTGGVYSGDIDGNNDAFCNGGDEEAAASSRYRGIQTAGDDGRVTFDTNFPGWYAGRANHIHFRVTVGPTQSLVSQLFFDEALNQEIYDSQPSYMPTDNPGYRSNDADGVIQQANLSLDEVVVSHAKQADGALLAWKAITIAV
ncbi:MAG: protocatechuate 3,4-dioxygenase [Polyangiaceae bacterium]|nr:protocatechuate 3,4-dioxygenase [Polyangiaceae bacterium]